jgi:dethiobiotin synthetase
LVEGIGGLLVPLGRNYTVADVIKKLRCPVVVVGRNRLGTLNHTLLTLGALQDIGIKDVRIVMMGEKRPDISARTNLKMIRKLAPKTPVSAIPNLGRGASREAIIKINAKYLKKTLARILEDDSVGVFFR